MKEEIRYDPAYADYGDNPLPQWKETLGLVVTIVVCTAMSGLFFIENLLEKIRKWMR